MDAKVAELERVTKRYGKLTALDAVSLALEPGRVTALLGPNGAGKTTAVRLLLGLTRPTAGAVRVFGGEPRSLAARRRTGVMLQIAKVPDTLRVREHVHLFCSYYPAAGDVDAILSTAGLTSLANRRYGDLSGGQRRRVQFALAICGRPELLFLDEPTVGLDVEARRGLWREIRELARRGCSILLTTHYLEEADAIADRVVVINRGTIVADGSPRHIRGLGASRRVRCVTTLPASDVRGLDGVQSVLQEGSRLEILSRDAEGLARELLTRDPALSQLEITGLGLEDAFLALTATAGQDHVSTGGVR